MAESPRPLVVSGGTVVDEQGERRGDVVIEGGLIAAVGTDVSVPSKATILDASGCLVSPGLVDLHTHLREPGGERAETIESGARAAALGGYTAVVAMPNTDPPIDSGFVVRDVLALSVGASVQVSPAGAITLGRAGERLAPMAEMASLGVRIFTDDGTGVQDGGLMRRALEYGRDLGVVLAQHCEDRFIGAAGHMNEGAVSSRLGIAGQPGLAEEAMLYRDLRLCELVGAPMHFLHLSTSGSVELLSAAKAAGLNVTAEVAPHHLALTDEEVVSFDPRFKVNPPLRSEADRLALEEAVRSGLFDAIATDHAPHPEEDKEAPFEEAPFGMTGLETALSICFELFCANGVQTKKRLSLVELFALFSWRPAQIAGLRARYGQGGPIAPGQPAHLCVFDPAASWTVDPKTGGSKSSNSPFAGRKVSGRVRHTVFDGVATVIDSVPTR